MRALGRRALGAAMVGFAKEIGAVPVAEGVKTAAELDSVIELGMTSGQGYLLGVPSVKTGGLGKVAPDATATGPVEDFHEPVGGRLTASRRRTVRGPAIGEVFCLPMRAFAQAWHSK